MPTELITTTTPRDPRGAATANMGSVVTPVPRAVIAPIQIAGFVPLRDCSAVECRKPNDQTCSPWRNNVFGNVSSGKGGIPTPIATSTYENDWSTFGVDISLFSSNPLNCTVTWQLQKCSDPNTWTTVQTLNSNTYGRYYNLNTIPGHLNYSIFSLNWGVVLHNKGVGVYRIKVISVMKSLTGCKVSDPFFLRQFTCQLANGTVKFESTLTGLKGAHYGLGKLFDLCEFTFFDSIRLPGSFGKETVPEYTKKFNKHQNGKLFQITNEAIQKYKYNSKLLPKEYHDRFKVYLMMAEVQLVSDYNISNPDYNIKQFPIFSDGNYEPTYFDKEQNRYQMVEVIFKPGKQNIISSLCCSITGGRG